MEDECYPTMIEVTREKFTIKFCCMISLCVTYAIRLVAEYVVRFFQCTIDHRDENVLCDRETMSSGCQFGTSRFHFRVSSTKSSNKREKYLNTSYKCQLKLYKFNVLFVFYNFPPIFNMYSIFWN